MKDWLLNFLPAPGGSALLYVIVRAESVELAKEKLLKKMQTTRPNSTLKDIGNATIE